MNRSQPLSSSLRPQTKKSTTRAPKTIYNVEVERRLITEHNLHLISLEIEKFEARSHLISIKTLVDSIRFGVQNALFGCKVDVGLCTDPNMRVVDFYGDRSYLRKVYRGDSGCFHAMDRREIVVEMDALQNIVVFVPFIGPTSSHGVLEIHGLIPELENVSEADYFKRQSEVLKKMIENGDYSFKDQTRLWKKVSVPKFAGIPQKTSSYMTVSGRVKEVVYTKNGIRFFGGPRFNIVWEDGSKDVELPAADVVKIYHETAQSLGSHTVFSSSVTERLRRLGRQIGRFLESRKAQIFLKELRQKIKQQKVNIVGMVEMALQSMPLILLGIREISLIGYKADSDEFKTLVYYSMLGIRKPKQQELAKQGDSSSIDTSASFAPKKDGNYSLSAVDLASDLVHSSHAILDDPHHRRHRSPKKSSPVKSAAESLLTRKDLHSTVWTAMELIVPADFLWGKSGDYTRYLVVVHKQQRTAPHFPTPPSSSSSSAAAPTTLSNGEEEDEDDWHPEEDDIAPFDREIIEGVVLEIEQTIKSIWKVESRRKRFRDFVKSLEPKLFEWRNSSVNELCFNLLSSIPADLLKAHMYIGMVQAGGDDLFYLASTLGSKMEGRRLSRGHGVSFDVVDSGETLIFAPNDMDKKKKLVPGAIVDVYYGRARYKATIARNRGHELYDVRYHFDRKVEAGVEMARIIPMDVAFRAKLFERAKLPFVCVPIRNRSKVIGVMGVDHIDSASFVTAETIDEDLRVFLEQIGKLLGNALDVRQKKALVQSLFIVSKNTHADIPDVVQSLFDSIFRCSPFIDGVVFAEAIKKENESAPEPLASHLRNVSKLSNSVSTRPRNAVVPSSVPMSARQPLSARKPPRLIGDKTKQNPLVYLGRKGHMSAEIEKKLSSFDVTKYGKRAVQRIGNKGVWLFCNVSTNQENHLYPIVLSYRTPIPDVDHEFFDTLQKTVSSVLETIISQKASGEFRYEALLEIKKLCHDHYLLNKRRSYNIFKHYRSEFFNRIVDVTLSCYHSTNMYVGILGKFANEINYILASLYSQMMGKSLARNDTKGVSFEAVDGNQVVCVTAGSLLSQRMKHFGDRQHFEYPLIVVPLIAGVDSIIGILAADNCAGDQLAETVEQLEDVISFFTTISIYLGNIVQQYRVVDVNEQLVNLASTVSSFAEGFPRLKNLLTAYLPFATRIVETSFRPQVEYFITHEAKSAHIKIPPITQHEFVLLLSVKDVKLFFSERFVATDKPKLKILVKGQVQQEIPIDIEPEKHGDVARITHAPRAAVPIKIVFPKNTSMDKIKVQFLLTMKRDGLDKEIASKSLSFHYFLHVPLSLQEHFFDSDGGLPQSNNDDDIPTHHNYYIRLGSMKLCSKLLMNNQIVGFHCQSISCSLEFAAGHEDTAAETEIYVSLKWNQDYVGRTPPLKMNHHSLNWQPIHAFLPINSFTDLKKNELFLEFFCFSTSATSANRNREFFMGSTLLTGEALARMFLQVSSSHWAAVPLDGSGSECPKWITRLDFGMHGSVLPVRHTLVDDFALLNLLKLHDDAAICDSELQSGSVLIKEEKVRTLKLVEEYVACELKIFRARDLFLPPSIVDKLGGSVFEIFVGIVFNGESVGSTSFAKEDLQPEWRDEQFRVMLPLSNPNSWKDELEGSLLMLEVFVVKEETNEHFRLGTVSVEGSDLGTLFLGKTPRKIWYDMENENSASAAPTAATAVLSAIDTGPAAARPHTAAYTKEGTNTRRIITSQLLLCGYPATRTATKEESVSEPVDHGFLQVSMSSLSDTLALARSLSHELMGTVSVSIAFNDRELVCTSEKDVLFSAPRVTWDDVDEEIVVFRHPSPKTLFQSQLQFTVWHTLRGVKSKVSEFIFSENDIVKLFGKAGIVTRWCSLPLLNALGEDNHCDLEINAGPHGKPKIFEYDHFVLWLDLACCAYLSFAFKPPPRDNYRLDHRPNVYALVLWNNEVVGRTEIEEHFSNIVYERQRFILRVPMFYDESQRLVRCKLRVELRHQPYDQEEKLRPAQRSLLQTSKSILTMKNAKFLHNTEESVLIGAIEMQGEELLEFFRDDLRPVMKWFRLKLAAEELEEKYEAERQRLRGNRGTQGRVSVVKAENKSFIKLRGCIAGSLDDYMHPTNDPQPFSTSTERTEQKRDLSVIEDSYSDYVLHVLRAINLANTDAFGGANAYVEVQWLDETIGYTQVVPDTLDQVFSHEQFVLRWNKANKYESPHLQLMVWSISPGKPKTFLGKVEIAGNRIIELLHDAEQHGSTDEKSFSLETDLDMTKEENEHVGGKLWLEIEKIDYTEVIQGEKMVEECTLWVQSAHSLPSFDSFNSSPSTFFVVFRSYEREGGEWAEIYRSITTNSSSNPIYASDFVPVLAPNQTDWSGFAIRIDYCNAFDKSVFGRLLLKDERLKRILSRDTTQSVMELRDYALDMVMADSAEAVSRLNTASELPRVFLGGGMREVFVQVERQITLEQNRLLSGQLKKASMQNSSFLDPHDMTSFSKSALERVNEGESDSEEERDRFVAFEDESSGADHPRTRPSTTTTASNDATRKKEAEKMSFELELTSLMLQIKNISSQLVEGSSQPDAAVSSKKPTNPSLEGFIEIRWKHLNLITLRTAHYKLQFSGSVLELDCERFTLDKPEGIHISTCALEFIIFQKFQFKEAVPLAELILFGDDLVTVLHRSPRVNRESKWKFSFSKSALSSGKGEAWLSLSLRVIPNTENSPLFNNKISLDDPKTNYGKSLVEIELTIIAAAGLAKSATFMGSTNPFAVITYNFTNLGQTTTITDTLDPVWPDNQSFIFRFPKKYDAMMRVLSSQSRAQSSAANSRTNSRASRRRQSVFKLAEEQDDTLLSADGIYSVEHLTIHIDFYSQGSMGSNAFLGCVELSGDLIQETISENIYFTKGKKWLPLVPTTRRKQAEQKNIHGKVQVLLTKLTNLFTLTRALLSSRQTLVRPNTTASDSNDAVPPVVQPEDLKEIDIVVLAARDILLTDKADTYVKVRWNGRIIGTTYIEKQSDSPMWRNEKFTIRVLSTTVLSECLLHVELWQFKSVLGQNNQDVLLGACEITGDTLEEFIKGTESTQEVKLLSVPKQQSNIRWIKLGRCGYLPEKVQLPALQAVKSIPTAIQLNCHYSDHQANNGPTRRFEVKVFSAEDLANLSKTFSSMEVFVITKWNGREIGRTYTVKGSVSPLWRHQVSPLVVPSNRNFYEDKLSFEVWNQNRFVRNDFLGLLELTEDELVSILDNSKIKRGVRRKYSLSRDHVAYENTQKYEIQGYLDIGVKLVLEDKSHSHSFDDTEEESGGVRDKMTLQRLEEEMQVNWLENMDVRGGKPFLEIDVLGVQVVPMQRPHGGEIVGGGLRALSDTGSQGHSVSSAATAASNALSGLFNRMQKVATSSVSSNPSQRNTLLNKKALLSAGSSSWKPQPSCTVSWNFEEVNHLPPVMLSEKDWTGSWEMDLRSPLGDNSDASVTIQPFTSFIPLPDSQFELERSHLMFEVWDKDDFASDFGYLGGLSLPFEELLRLYCGRFTFSLLNNINPQEAANAGQPLYKPNPHVWRANITFSIKFVFPFWDSSIPLLPKKYRRKVTILGASNLPLINGELPNTKCVLSVNGIVALQSMLIAGQSHPNYPRIVKEFLLDVDQPLRFSVEIIHVNIKNRKEVKLGEEEIPFEYLLRPPRQSIDLFIGPSKDPAAARRQREGEFKFALSGSIRVLIEGNNRVAEDYMPFISPNHQIQLLDKMQLLLNPAKISLGEDHDSSDDEHEDKSLASIVQHSESFAWSSLEVEEVGHIDEHHAAVDWIATPFSLCSAQEIASQPQWMLLPVYDVGLSIGLPKVNLATHSLEFSGSHDFTDSATNALIPSALTVSRVLSVDPSQVITREKQEKEDTGVTFIGTKPGYRFAFAIERSLTQPAVSDKTLLEEIVLPISSYMARLRWKDVNRKLREVAFHCIQLYAQQAMEKMKLALTSHEAEIAKTALSSNVVVEEEKDRAQHWSQGPAQQLISIVRRCLELCFPGCHLRWVTIGEDFETLYYQCYAPSSFAREQTGSFNDVQSHNTAGASHNSRSERKVVPARQGDDQQYFGKQNHKSMMVHTYEHLKHSPSASVDSTALLLFHPFVQAPVRFPRFNMMFFSEDCSYGMMQIENFHFYQNGLPTNFGDDVHDINPDLLEEDNNGLVSVASEYTHSTAANSLGVLDKKANYSANVNEFKEIRQWLETIGALCGDFIHAQLEMRVLSSISEYLSHYCSHSQGLFAVVLEEVLQGLQGCKMSELLSVDAQECKINSLLVRHPPSSLSTANLLYTHRVSIDGIQISIKRSHAAAQASERMDGESGTSNNSGNGNNNKKMLDKLGGNVLRLFSHSTDDHDLVPGASLRERERERVIEPVLELEKDDGESEEQELFGRWPDRASQSSIRAKSRFIDVDKLVLGVRYDNFEQVVPLQFDAHTDTLCVAAAAEKKAIHLFLKSDFLRQSSAGKSLITLSLYEVDELMSPVHENVGQLHNVVSLLQSVESSDSFEGEDTHTMSVKTILSPITARNEIHYEAMFELSAAATVDATSFAARGGAISTKNNTKTNNKDTLKKKSSGLPPIKGFRLHILRAFQLKTLKNNAPPSVFCEVSFQKKVVQSTKIVKNTTAPEFGEDIYVPFNANNNNKTNSRGISNGKQNDANSSLIIDLYDMSFLTKGNFFGRVEIPLENLVATVGQAAVVKDYPLQATKDLQAKKQTHVGGTLSLSIFADSPSSASAASSSAVPAAAPAVTAGDSPAASESTPGAVNETDSVNHWARVRQMNNPQIKLTIESAHDLMSANRFGGGSDPFALIYFSFPPRESVQRMGGTDRTQSTLSLASSTSRAVQSDESEEPIARTTVKPATLNPIWNESFDLSLLVNAQTQLGGGATRERFLSLSDLPVLRVELYDHNELTSPTFLGECEIAPEVYLHSNEASLTLVPKTVKNTTLASTSNTSSNNMNRSNSSLNNNNAKMTVKNKASAIKASALLSHFTQKQIKGNLRLHWEFFNRNESTPGERAQERWRKCVWHPHGGLTRLDCLDLRILHAVDLQKESKIPGIGSGCNPFVVIVARPRKHQRRNSKSQIHAPSPIVGSLKEEEERENEEDEDSNSKAGEANKRNDSQNSHPSAQMTNAASVSVSVASTPTAPAPSARSSDKASSAVSATERLLGKTRRKKNTLSPVFDESLSLNISSLFAVSGYADIVFQVWHKDDFFGTEEKLGEAVLRAERYLHPERDGDAQITLDLTDRADATFSVGHIAIVCQHVQVSQSLSLNKHNYELFHRYAHSTGIELITMDMEEAEAEELKKKNPIYAQKRLITMVYDPTLETDRQRRENVVLPSLLQRANHQLENYMRNPFARTGLISELHFGQLCAAARRGDKTVLRTDLADMLCIPLFAKKNLMSSTAGSANNNRNSHDHSSPIKKDKKRKTNDVDEEDEEAPSSSSISAKASSLPSSLSSSQGSYLVCRYPASRISLRDMRLLEKVQKHVLQCPETLAAREKRKQSLLDLLQNISSTAAMLGLSPASSSSAAVGKEGKESERKPKDNSTAVDPLRDIGVGGVNATDVLVQTMLDLEVSMNCVAKCYLLHEDGQTFHPLSMETGKAQPLVLNTPQAIAQHEHTHSLAALLRHDVMLQYYQDRVSIVRCAWSNLPFSQVDLPEVQELYEAVESLLGVAEAKRCRQTIKTLRELSPDGCFAMPIYSFQEVMIGFVLLKNINRNPFAVYEYYQDDRLLSKSNNSKNAVPFGGPGIAVLGNASMSEKRSRANTRASIDLDYDEEIDDDEDEKKRKRKIATIRGMEYGITQLLLKSSLIFSDVLLVARLNNAYKSVRSFPLRPDTSPLTLMRYVFRMLVTAIPAVREVSIWAVHLPNAQQLLSAMHAQERLEAIQQAKEQQQKAEKEKNAGSDRPLALGVVKKQPSMLQRMLSFSSKSGEHDGPAAGGGAVTGMTNLFASFRGPITLSSNKNDSSKPHAAPSTANIASHRSASSSTGRSSVVGVKASDIPRDLRVVQGVFGSEDPSLLLAAALERKTAGALTGSTPTSFGQRVKSKQSEEQKMAERKAEDAAGWKVQFPKCFQEKPADISQKQAQRTVQSFSLDIAYHEIVRCVEEMHEKSFQLHTGHCLSRLCVSPAGADVAIRDLLMSTVFNPIFVFAQKQRTAMLAGDAAGTKEGGVSSPSAGSSSRSRPQRAPIPAGPPPDRDSARVPPNSVRRGNIALNPTLQAGVGDFSVRSAHVAGSSAKGAAVPVANTGPSSPAAATSVRSYARRGNIIPRPPPININTDGASSAHMSASQMSSGHGANIPSSRTRRSAVHDERLAGKNMYFFLTATTHGVGGETGWGHIGPHTQKAIETFSALLDAGLAKLAKLRTDGMTKRLAEQGDAEQDDERSEGMTADHDYSTVGTDKRSSVKSDESDSDSESQSVRS